jgi:hypothetical protein
MQYSSLLQLTHDVYLDLEIYYNNSKQEYFYTKYNLVKSNNLNRYFKTQLPQVFFKKRIHFLLHIPVGAFGNIHGMRPQW